MKRDKQPNSQLPKANQEPLQQPDATSEAKSPIDAEEVQQKEVSGIDFRLAYITLIREHLRIHGLD
jgi:hypothetical protein